MAKANGAIGGTGGKLYPMKVHDATSRDTMRPGRMVQYDVLWNFMTGKYEEAAARGVSFMGLRAATMGAHEAPSSSLPTAWNQREIALACARCRDRSTQDEPTRFRLYVEKYTAGSLHPMPRS